MERNERTRRSLIMHYQRYPHLQIQDVLKYLYQSAFGCEHLVSSLESATQYIYEEHRTTTYYDNEFVDALDGTYSRVSLSYLNHGLSVETLGKLFFVSAKRESSGRRDLEDKIHIAKELVRENKLPFSLNEFEKKVQAWKTAGFPAIRHSNEFRDNYNPAYRVISNEYVPFLPLFERIDKIFKERSMVIAIEGRSASGKTTLCEMLKKIYNCTVFHMDDFFLRPQQRTQERYAEIGGNVDRERILSEVLIPISKNEHVKYQRFDCSTMTLAPVVEIIPQKMIVLEGTYSMHPELSDYYDLSVFLDISPELQRERIKKRNTLQTAERFFNEWIPLEEVYFSQMQVKRRCDISIPIYK